MRLIFLNNKITSIVELGEIPCWMYEAKNSTYWCFWITNVSGTTLGRRHKLFLFMPWFPARYGRLLGCRPWRRRWCNQPGQWMHQARIPSGHPVSFRREYAKISVNRISCDKIYAWQTSEVQLSGCQAAAYYIRHDLWHVREYAKISVNRISCDKIYAWQTSEVLLSGYPAAAYYIRHDLWHVNYERGIIPPFHFVRRYS